jgi:hypothetical protein
MSAWSMEEFERLFRDHPPTEPSAPRGSALADLARELRRSTGSVAAQWADARSAVLHTQTAASRQLIGYLIDREWLESDAVSLERGLPEVPTRSGPEADPPQLLTVWVEGRPAPFATAGERPWKERIDARVPRPSGHPVSGLVLDFTLPHPPSWPAHPDIDNLCEPVFATLINRLGWFGGSRPALGWFLATKRPGAEPGVAISLQAGRASAPAALVSHPVLSATWPGPLPRSARDVDFVSWVREQDATLGPGPMAVALEFGSPRVNIGDIATGTVKSSIDCLQPILGGPFGDPDDHRVEALLVSKGVQGVPEGAVRVIVGAYAPEAPGTGADRMG